MFRNYFLISYRRHKCFCPISVIFFTKKRCEYFFENHFSVFFNKGKEVIPKTKRYFFGIEQFIKQLKKEGKLNFIVLDKSTHKDMVTDEVGVPNDVLVCLRTHHKYFSLIKWILGKNEKLIIIVRFWCTHNWSKWIFNYVYYLDNT